jgi:hypothetical protein
MNSFYADPAVRQRLVEFSGGSALENATAIYLTHPDGCQFQRSELRAPQELGWFLEQEIDIARSLADRESLLLHLDLEYVNFDAPGEVFIDPWRAFDLQQPVVRAIEALLLGWGIRPLHLITGQGHHFVWRVRLASDIAAKLAGLDPAPELVAACVARTGTGLAAGVDPAMQTAFSGLGLVMEFLAHCIKQQASPETGVPVEITAVDVGRCSTDQREMISIDISEYGDPLHTRMIRMPFTHYLKPWITGVAQRVGMSETRRMRTVPLHEMDVRQALQVRRNEEDVRELARRACVRIPLQEDGTAALLAHYMNSPLRHFHGVYYSTRHDPPETWEWTYARTPLETFPPCFSDMLTWPNDRLLKPAGLQLVTRVLLAEGWHPRHIGGLIRSKFENPVHRWGVDWREYEPGTRADFYTRLFAGQWATGTDPLADFNCTTLQQKGICSMAGGDSCSLEQYRQSLLARNKP